MTKSTTPARRTDEPSAAGGENLNQRIREKAFELYQQRGGAHGGDLADWYEAERLVLQNAGRTITGDARPAASRGNGGRGRTASRASTSRKTGI